jgi:putative hydrolase of the HAD superfamily
LREEWIFKKILEKYPQMIFAVASNHISMMRESLKHLWILETCKVVLISWDCGYEKPEVWFYQVLIDQLWLSADEILFIDDKKENIEGAKKVWLQTLHYRGENLLSESIFSYLDSMN